MRFWSRELIPRSHSNNVYARKDFLVLPESGEILLSIPVDYPSEITGVLGPPFDVCETNIPECLSDEGNRVNLRKFDSYLMREDSPKIPWTPPKADYVPWVIPGLLEYVNSAENAKGIMLCGTKAGNKKMGLEE